MAFRLPGQRAGLTRQAVLAAARGLLSEKGIEAVTMRAVADRLGVAPNALYSHVAGKTELIDDLLDEVLAGVPLPDAYLEEPGAGLHHLLVSTYGVLLAHPDLVPLYLSRQGAQGPNAQQLGRVMGTLLARGGVPEQAAREALRVLVVYTIGFAAFATRPWVEPGTEPKLGPKELRDNFSKGLGWLLSGILRPGR